MSNSKLPERASLEYLKKLAKDRLREMRRTAPHTKLAAALLAVARDHGYPSWRALQGELDQRHTRTIAEFFAACERNDIAALSDLLAKQPDLVRAASPDRHWTGLHAAAERGHTAAVRLLLEHGADANAREEGDNAYALHFAAGYGRTEAARALLDAAADVHGHGDLHETDVIGWATALVPDEQIRADMVALLLERGAHHHIFSAIAVGDLELIQQLVEHNPAILDRRMSRFEQGQTCLHFAIARKRHDILQLLIDLGADLEATDLAGRTALAVAMLRGDREAMQCLHAAGARQPEPVTTADFTAGMARHADSVFKSVTMIGVPHVAETVDWFASLGFRVIGRNVDAGEMNWAMLAFGRAELMLNIADESGPHETTLWFYTQRIEPLYQLLKARQLEAAQASLRGESADQMQIDFVEDIYEPFYGGRQFSIRAPHGYTLTFLEPQD